MSDHQDHPIAGLIFLLLAASAIILGAKAGIEGSRKSEVNARIREAVELGRSGEFEEAEARLRAILRRHPDDTDALFNLGVALLARDEDDEADRAFARVLEIVPEDYDALAERAAIQKRRGNVDRAIAILETIPAGKANLKERLARDPLWEDLHEDARMRKLMEKHGAGREARRFFEAQ